MASDGKSPDATAAAADTPVPFAQPAPATVTQINPDLRLEKLTNGKTYLRKTSDGSAQEISIAVYDAMIGQHLSKRSAPSSGITGLASAKEEDSEIERGDMDPEAARNLQSSSETWSRPIRPSRTPGNQLG